MEIKETINEFIKTRKYNKSKNATAYAASVGYDTQFIESVLLNNHSDTLKFLKQATAEEIAISVEALEALIEKFNDSEIIKIFEEKGKEFPNIEEISEYDYFETIEESKKLLNR